MDTKNAYDLIIQAIDDGQFGPGDKMVENELAIRFGMSRTPVREALQRMETQNFLKRNGRSLVVSQLDHTQLGELYIVRAELEGLAASLAAKHAAKEEVRVLQRMVEADRDLLGDPQALSRANRRFHRQIHLASHNKMLINQLESVHQTMALLDVTSLAADGRGEEALAEHQAVVDAIRDGDSERASQNLKRHLSQAFEARIALNAQS